MNIVYIYIGNYKCWLKVRSHVNKAKTDKSLVLNHILAKDKDMMYGKP